MKVSITGIADINRVLREIAPREARNIMRATVHDIAGQLVRKAREYSPDDTGLLDRSTKAKREAQKKRDVVSSSVIVEKVAYYWRFLEYGRGPDHVEHAMFLKALRSVEPDIDRIYAEAFVRKLLARLDRVSRG